MNTTGKVALAVGVTVITAAIGWPLWHIARGSRALKREQKLRRRQGQAR